MKTRERNIYSIGRAWGAASLLAALALLAVAPGPAMAQCEDLGGAGDQYCEGLPGAGDQQGVREPRINPGVPEPTGRALDRAGAGAVRLVESPRQKRHIAREAVTPPASTGDGPGEGAPLPYILGGLSLILLGTALLARRRRGGVGGSEDAGP